MYLTTSSYTASPSILRSSGSIVLYTGSLSVNASLASVHHQPNSSPPSPQPSRPNSVRMVVVDSSSSSRSTARSGSCQQTVGLVSLKCTPLFIACRCSAQPGPASKPGRFKKMHASSCSRVFHSSLPARAHTPFLRPSCLNCHSSSESFLASFSTRSLTFFSDSYAPYEQHPCTSSGAGSVSTPW